MHRDELGPARRAERTSERLLGAVGDGEIRRRLITLIALAGPELPRRVP